MLVFVCPVPDGLSTRLEPEVTFIILVCGCAGPDDGDVVLIVAEEDGLSSPGGGFREFSDLERTADSEGGVFNASFPAALKVRVWAAPLSSKVWLPLEAMSSESSEMPIDSKYFNPSGLEHAERDSVSKRNVKPFPRRSFTNVQTLTLAQ